MFSNSFSSFSRNKDKVTLKSIETTTKLPKKIRLFFFVALKKLRNKTFFFKEPSFFYWELPANSHFPVFPQILIDTKVKRGYFSGNVSLRPRKSKIAKVLMFSHIQPHFPRDSWFSFCHQMFNRQLSIWIFLFNNQIIDNALSIHWNPDGSKMQKLQLVPVFLKNYFSTKLTALVLLSKF